MPDRDAGPTTRDRVLDRALTLFNARGPASVTTAEIAEASGIREGNLYYYFKRKEQIVAALFDRFEAAVIGIAARDLSRAATAEPYAEYLGDFFRLMWRWRCFYRDFAALAALAPEVGARARDIHARGKAETVAAVRSMVRHGLLRANEAEIEALQTNAWIVSSFWIDYLYITGATDTLTEEHIAWGHAQVRALYAPYLTERGAAFAGALAPPLSLPA